MQNTAPTSKIIKTLYFEPNASDYDKGHGLKMLQIACFNVELAALTFYSDITKESYRSKYLLNILMDLQVSELLKNEGNYTT